jgi:hypothetical protein
MTASTSPLTNVVRPWAAVRQGQTDTFPCHAGAVTELGVHEGQPLVVDLRGQAINSSSSLWDALAEPCGLPTWFGRNLNAWWDTIETGAISETLDRFNGLVVVVDAHGLFSPGNPDGEAFLEVTNRSRYAKARVDP